MKHPIDVTYLQYVNSKGEDSEGFAIELIQENPTYSPSMSSEHIFFFKSGTSLKRFLKAQDLEAVYDVDALEALEDGEDEE